MKENKVAKAMIRSAVERGVSDIQENPGRGIRRLVDLGELFAMGRFQKAFFRIAGEALQDESSPYYQLIERAVCPTSADFLITYGMNLGYNSWTYGADAIRETEAREGFNIPWVLLFDLRRGEALTAEAVGGVIDQGLALGIFCHIFFLGGDARRAERLLDELAGRAGCSWVLFLPPEAVTASLVDRVAEMKTVLLALDMDSGPKELAAAAALLLKKKLLCAGFYAYDGATPGDGDLALLEQAEELGMTVVAYVQKQGLPEKQAGGRDPVSLLRERLAVPVFPIDLLRDLALADRNISTEACLAVVTGEGTITLTDMEEGRVVGSHNITETTLKEALAASLSKKGRA